MARELDRLAPIDLAPWHPTTGPVGFDIEVVDEDEAVICLRGELDLAGVGMFEAAALRLLSSGAHTIVLDLHDLDFLDVSGINAVLGLARTARVSGCELVLRRPRRQARRLLAQTRAAELLTIE